MVEQGPADVDEADRLGAIVRARLRGFAEVAAVQRAELRELTEEQAAKVADELLGLLPVMPTEQERGSGPVEQQRLFARARV